MGELEQVLAEGSSRYKLTEQLEAHAKQLQAIRKDSFVDSSSLCKTCRWATIFRLASENNQRIKCGELNQWMPDNVNECSAYQNIIALSLSQMVDMATLIGGHEARKAGFLND